MAISIDLLIKLTIFAIALVTLVLSIRAYHRLKGGTFGSIALLVLLMMILYSGHITIELLDLGGRVAATVTMAAVLVALYAISRIHQMLRAMGAWS